jgi:hypothetical protein
MRVRPREPQSVSSAGVMRHVCDVNTDSARIIVVFLHIVAVVHRFYFCPPNLTAVDVLAIF